MEKQPWGWPQSSPHLCEVELQLPAVEFTLVELYPCSGCGFWLAEVDPHSAKAFEQLECDLLIIEGEQSFEPLLQGGSKAEESGREEQNPINGEAC